MYNTLDIIHRESVYNGRKILKLKSILLSRHYSGRLYIITQHKEITFKAFFILAVLINI